MLFSAIAPVVVEDPCDPNPCGPNSNPPRNLGSTCHCTCLPGMIGSPPNCRPECVVNSECPSDKACINRKCQDPCPGLCGINAYCSVRNHVPLCICNQGYIGDPFSSCYRPTTTSKISLGKLSFNDPVSYVKLNLHKLDPPTLGEKIFSTPPLVKSST